MSKPQDSSSSLLNAESASTASAKTALSNTGPLQAEPADFGYVLRDYQQQAVQATLQHFRKTNDPAVIVLPTGAGKSLVIAELARLAKKRILVLTHVKELVEQNQLKFQATGRESGVYSAGLKRKETHHQVTFASVQSVARNLDAFNKDYSLVIIDECHRLQLNSCKNNGCESNQDKSTSQYEKIIQQLASINSDIKILGLTATPYRLGLGWIYQNHHRGFVRSETPRPFKYCIYELPLRYLIKKEYLTPPEIIDAPIAQYDFSSLSTNHQGDYNATEVNQLLVKHQRVTQSITEQIVEVSQDRHRKGVMIFAATVAHAQEILSYLPTDETALIVGDTELAERDKLINHFKQKKLRYLVNVSVLTTGFDAPHIDLIAILRPTESVSLYQQIVGRGLRLAENKKECLIIDYAGNNHDIYMPEVGEQKPNSQSVPVQVHCPSCTFANTFWGITDDDGHIIEHYGRRCKGIIEDTSLQCDYRFRFKECPQCSAENDIAARQCHDCGHVLSDPDEMLKKALQLSDAMIIRCSGMTLQESKQRLKVIYHDEHGEELNESFDLTRPAQRIAFNKIFSNRIKSKLNLKHAPSIDTLEQALALSQGIPHPDFVIARKSKHFWKIQQRIFDYQGSFRKANQLR